MSDNLRTLGGGGGLRRFPFSSPSSGLPETQKKAPAMHLTQGRLLLVSGSLNVFFRLRFLFPAVGGLQPCLRHKCHLVSSFHWDLDLDFSGLTLLRIFLAIYLFIISTLNFLASYHGYYYCGVCQFIGFGSFSA